MIKEFLQSKTIKSRIIRYNFFIICVIAVLVSIGSYFTANKKTKEIAKNSLQNHVGNISYRFQMAYDEMINIVLNCTERVSFDLEELGDFSTPEAGKKGLSYVTLLNNFCAISGYGSYISKLTVFNETNMVQVGNSPGSADDNKKVLNTDWFYKELEKPISLYQLELVESPYYNDNRNILPLVRPLSGTKGWALICLSDKFFQDILSELSEENELVVTTSGKERIASVYELEEHREENDKIIKRLLNLEENTGLLEMKIHGEDSILAYEKCETSGLLVFEVIPLDSLSNDKLLVLQTIIAMFLACIVIGLILSIIFTNQVNKPIHNLLSHINSIAEGNFAINKAVESGDEIGLIGKTVNDMSSQIAALMEERIEDEKEKSDLEFKMLQAQINPHFLYNTLDSIKWIAVIQKNSGIVKVVTALSGLLKNMAKGFNEKVTLQQELDFLSDYVTIEKVKYVELFDLIVEVDDPVLYTSKVIKLTLQPLVENAIFSGIEPSGKNGIIHIHAYSEDGNLFLVVKDNGMGIAEDKLSNILNETEKIKGDRMSGIGLPNVDRRIKLTYGEEYGIKIKSKVGEYTEIIIKTPLEY